MIYIIPFFISFLFYLLKPEEFNDNENLLFGLLSWILIGYELLFISSDLLILILIWLLGFYWLLINEDKNIIGYIFLISTYLCISSTSLISFFISVEILSFLMMILVNLYLLDRYPGILYYFFSGLFSALFILSLGYLSIGYLISYSLINIVFFYKLSLAPFHILLPQIYNSLSPRIIFLIDIPYKILLFYLLNKISIILIDITPIIFLSFIIGSYGILAYRNLLNIMIYSSLYHYGLILIPLYFGHWDYFIIYLIIYSFIILIYLHLIIFKYFLSSSRYYQIFWFILLFNLIGIPPFNGFFIKFFSLYLMIYNHYFLLFFIASLGILLLTYIYLRILLSKSINTNNILYQNQFFAHFISSILILSSFPLIY